MFEIRNHPSTAIRSGPQPSPEACPRCAVFGKIQEATFAVGGVPVREMLAFPLNVAAKLIGVDYQWIYRRVRRGDLRMSPGKVISRAELERFLAEDYFETEGKK